MLRPAAAGTHCGKHMVSLWHEGETKVFWLQDFLLGYGVF
jgi:hypothetical protein